MITCSTDSLVNLFNFEGKKSMKEEDEVLEGTYCCDQALVDCGFIPNTDKFFALTFTDTIEIVNSEAADLFTRITKVSHYFYRLIYFIVPSSS